MGGARELSVILDSTRLDKDPIFRGSTGISTLLCCGALPMDPCQNKVDIFDKYRYFFVG